MKEAPISGAIKSLLLQFMAGSFSDEVAAVAINVAGLYCIIDPLNQRIRQ